MPEEKETFREWLSKQEGVKWEQPKGFVMQLKYKGIDCAGLLTKVFHKRKMIYGWVVIRPIQSIHDIGMGCGGAITIYFKLK